MRLVLFALVLLLVGCASAPGPFPEAPKSLMQKAKPLEPIQLEDRDHIALSEMLAIVATNHGVCNENSIKYTAWQEWYKEQKLAYDKANLKIK